MCLPDFRQIELRLLAHLSGDPSLLAIFNNPYSDDIFRELTSQWWVISHIMSD